jgi:hypothetical protein
LIDGSTLMSKHLGDLVERLLAAPSVFYAERLRASGITGETLTDSTWNRVPLTQRAELIRDQLDHPPHGTRRFADAAAPVRAGITGSGAEMLVLTFTANDLAAERAAGVRVLQRCGVRAGMRVANTLPGALVTPGSLLLGDVIEDIGALDVPLGAIESDTAAKQAWELIERVQPEVLVLESSPAERFFAAAPAGERQWLRGVVWLRRAAGPAPSATLRNFGGWQRTWLAIPEATSFVAATCSAAGLHVDESVFAEIVDGELVLTAVAGDTAIVRYASTLRAALTMQCRCGEPGPALLIA